MNIRKLVSVLLSTSLILVFSTTAFATLPATPLRTSTTSSGLGALSGSFFQVYLVNGWKRAEFDKNFRVLKNRGMDHVIWQWTADSFHKKTYYPTAMSGWENELGYDAVGISLASAKATGLQVWLGLNWTDDWWNHYANDKDWLQNEFKIGQKVCKELWSRYGSEYGDTIAGFYITMEVDNVNYDSAVQQQNMVDVYTTITNYIHKQTKKPVMVAPFFNEAGGATPQAYANFWGKILAKAPIDIIALQDGVGVHHATASSVGVWYQKMHAKIKAVRPKTELWSDLETFDEINEDYKPASTARILAQIKAEKPYVKKFTTYAWLEFNM